jgi:para-nitrobenzyl esterase
VAQLLQAFRSMRGLNLSPVVDGRTLPAPPFAPVASDLNATVPLMIGSTETEIAWNATMKFDPIDGAALHERVKGYAKIDDTAADRLIAVYQKGWPKADNLSLALIIGTDLSNFRTGTDTEAERKAMAAKAPVYKYYFQWYSPVRGGALRSYHTLDIPFVFENTTIAESMNGSGKDLQPLSDKMSAAYAAFARSGNPNTKLLPKWEPFTMEERGMMIFNNECRFAKDPFREQRLARIAEKAAGAPA